MLALGPRSLASFRSSAWPPPAERRRPVRRRERRPAGRRVAGQPVLQHPVRARAAGDGGWGHGPGPARHLRRERRLPRQGRAAGVERRTHGHGHRRRRGRRRAERRHLRVRRGPGERAPGIHGHERLGRARRGDGSDRGRRRAHRWRLADDPRLPARAELGRPRRRAVLAGREPADRGLHPVEQHPDRDHLGRRRLVHGRRAVARRCRGHGQRRDQLGGGLYFEGSLPSLLRVSIHGNMALYGEGGGVYLSGCPLASFVDCSVSGNGAWTGAGARASPRSRPRSR